MKATAKRYVTLTISATNPCSSGALNAERSGKKMRLIDADALQSVVETLEAFLEEVKPCT